MIRNANVNDLDLMCEVWNEVVNEEGFYKPFSKDEYKEKMLKNPDFSFDGVFLAFDQNDLVGFGIGIIKKNSLDNPNIPGYINCLLVKKEYRNKGFGNDILTNIENYFTSLNKKFSVVVGFLPSCYSWYIPETDKHDHPCAPAVRVNSKEYLFLLHHRYNAVGFEDAFHLSLSEYQISNSIEEILSKNEKDDIKIELYDKDKHFGLEEFYKDINIPDFEKVIRANLELKEPYPFLVVSEKGQIKGWTGAMWNEESGRGHFDGIAISESVRGRGLGKALFSLLAYNSKLNGAKFMTFYTGLTNHARYIYMGAGFKIVQTFAIMKKELK